MFTYSSESHVKSTSLVNSYVRRLLKSFEELGVKVPTLEVEQLAIFLVKTMGSESRDYHRPEHALDVSKLETPIPRLAAFFHDLIYLQVDSSWKNIKYLLEPFIPNDTYSVNMVECLKQTSDPWLHAIAAFYDIEGQTQLNPSNGINEFLSTVVMYKKLSPFLSMTDLLRAIACVEVTVFFAQGGTNRKPHDERLRQNFSRTLKKLKLSELKEEEFKNIFQDCASIVERDLSSFAAPDLSKYVSNTWNVMIENNPALRNSYFLISEYRKAVHGVVSFVSKLDPEVMYWDMSSPSKKYAVYNLTVGTKYLKTFGLALTLTECIAQLSGGDAPYELFMGPMKRSREHQVFNLGEALQFPNSSKLKEELSEEDFKIYTVLKEGRSYRSRFDQKVCPLGAYLFATKGWEKVSSLFDRATSIQDPRNPEECRAFLALFSKPLLQDTMDAFSKTAVFREKRLSELAATF